MKAWVLHGINRLLLEDVMEPVPGEREVLVRVKAAGICGSDIPRIYRTGTYSYPLIPGHEFSGVVEQAGADADQNWVGRRVGIFPLIPCGVCGPCRKQQYEMCRQYSYLGSRRDGGFAVYAAVPQDNLLFLPDEVSYEEAAMLEPMAVAVHAIRRAAPAVSEQIVVCGLGTIGMLVVMFLLEAGRNNLLVIGNKDFQKKMVVKMGISQEAYCDSRTADVRQWLKERTGGNGADVFFECVGKRETLNQAVDCAAPAGRVILVGNPGTDMGLEKAVYWKILRNQLLVTGTWNSSFTHAADDDWHYVLDRLAQKRIAPAKLITHRFGLEQLASGFRLMYEKKEEYGKVMGIF